MSSAKLAFVSFSKAPRDGITILSLEPVPTAVSQEISELEAVDEGRHAEYLENEKIHMTWFGMMQIEWSARRLHESRVSRILVNHGYRIVTSNQLYEAARRQS